MKRQTTILFCLTLAQLALHAQEYNVQNFGAVGDGITINTKAIQSAIDKCSVAGGKVVIPKGIFVSGTLHMKSNVELMVQAEGVLKGSSSFKDYPVNEIKYRNAFNHSFDGNVSVSRAFIFVEGAENISFTGTGSINGNGDAPEFNLGNDGNSYQSRQRPCMLLIVNCKKIKVFDLFLTNSAYWLQNYIGCDSLHIKGVTIYNHTNYNQDGIDIDSRNVLIEDCNIDVDDDGICFKSHERNNIVENVVVRNCKIASNCNAIKFGTASIGGLKNVTITNCSVAKASADHIRHWQQNIKFIEQPITVLSGIVIEAVDGAIVDNVRISDITITDVQTPIFIVLGNRGRRPVGDSVYRAGQIKNVYLRNITATGHSKMASSITAYPGNYIEQVTFENIVLNDMGKGTLQEAGKPLPENERAYPENRMYGVVYPSSSIYVRHARGIVLRNISLSVRNKDARPAIVFDDVHHSSIIGTTIQIPAEGTAAVWLIHSKKIIIEDPIFKSRISPLVELKGTKEKEVKVTGFVRYDGWLKISKIKITNARQATRLPPG
jgi:hypothetical protein